MYSVPIVYNNGPPVLYNAGAPVVYNVGPPLAYKPVVYAPPAAYGGPVVNAPPVQPVVRTQAVALSAGQVLGNITQRNGLSCDCFFVGEAVSAPGADGKKVVAQVTSVSAAGMVVNTGSGSKEFNPSEVITHVSKLLGAPFYIA